MCLRAAAFVTFDDVALLGSLTLTLSMCFTYFAVLTMCTLTEGETFCIRPKERVLANHDRAGKIQGHINIVEI